MSPINTNKPLDTGMIMDALSHAPKNYDEAKENLDNAVDNQKMMEAVARYKAAHTPIIKNNKINRNDPCPCGSGKKFKKCCMGNGTYDD